MSSWERTRYVPWALVQQSPTAAEAEDPDSEKERIFRQLRRDAAQEEAAAAKAKAGDQQDDASSSSSTSPSSSSVELVGASAYGAKPTVFGLKSAVPYTHTDLLRNVAFGCTIGSMTGAVFGFMDGMRSAQDSAVLKRASNVAKGRYLLQGTTRSGLLFGGVFGVFHSLKYGVRCLADPGDVVEITFASAVTLGAMSLKPVTRPSIPYAGMLILMDAFNIYMRDSTA
mmetsp:Transcript_4578/g.10239  ORF Transcript_4578/g.10239 Transcript_4578/m.10239 type:complete len:227 (+) Transcript_4578:170-850(+)